MSNDLQTNLAYIIMKNYAIFHTATLRTFFFAIHMGAKESKRHLKQHFKRLKSHCFRRFTSHENCKAKSYEKVVGLIFDMSTSNYFSKMETYKLKISNLIASIELCFAL